MPERATQRSVAVLYEHPLLGEGIARILLRETGAQVVVVSARDVGAVETALARRPDVVIFEGSRCRSWCEVLAPGAELIDVTPAMSMEPSHAAGDAAGDDVSADVSAERIVSLVRGGERHGEPV